jgi:hypothetical protein
MMLIMTPLTPWYQVGWLTVAVVTIPVMHIRGPMLIAVPADDAFFASYLGPKLING